MLERRDPNFPSFLESALEPDFKERILRFKEDWYNDIKKISEEVTPQVDGTGKKIIDQKGNYDYIIVSYMVERLDKYFPGWSWEPTAPIQLLGGEWVIAEGVLCIIDEKLLAFGVVPPYRKYYGTAAARITYKKDSVHTPDNIIDIGNNVKSANTEAMKVSINRLTHIGDDVYGKRIEEDGMGSLEEVLQSAIVEGGGSVEFGRWVADNHWKWGDIFAILGVKSMTAITDFGKAMEDVKKAKGRL